MHDMTRECTVVDLFTQFLEIAPNGIMRADERGMADGDTDWRVAMFHAESADDVHADHWEKHALADEAVCCLHGAIRLWLRAGEPGAPDDSVRLLPGRAVIVPRDRWHRFEFEEPTDLLALTVRQGTQLERWT
ncbi:MAG TPA: cupin [Acidimicrobiia bacterium]|jgi:mannose-6-phosphate isomerase-like protein (cupin superfamily)